MTTMPEDLETLLTRRQLADALTKAGFPTSPATLATKASRGGGPPYQRYGPRAMYRWAAALQWANDLLRSPASAESQS
jgi:hypothetical protein